MELGGRRCRLAVHVSWLADRDKERVCHVGKCLTDRASVAQVPHRSLRGGRGERDSVPGRTLSAQGEACTADAWERLVRTGHWAWTGQRKRWQSQQIRHIGLQYYAMKRNERDDDDGRSGTCTLLSSPDLRSRIEMGERGSGATCLWTEYRIT